MAAELAKLRGLLAQKTEPGHGRDWAHRIVTQAQQGVRVSAAQLRLAREALRGRTAATDEDGSA